MLRKKSSRLVKVLEITGGGWKTPTLSLLVAPSLICIKGFYNQSSVFVLDMHRHATGFTDKKKFLQALDALKADGGGDCPEMAIHGMERVFRHGFEAGSPMFVITDAGAKDFDMSDNYGVIADSYQPITSIFVSKQTGISLYFY